ncbi:hypothetical protein GOODEAATRI_025582 [Goodea atripinnis]|uniref:Uncharacterized protein n=1 Tax=Goodea atripinnis TaxID=208336 RepID=A0ABV0MNP7_9TELE
MTIDTHPLTVKTSKRLWRKCSLADKIQPLRYQCTLNCLQTVTKRNDLPRTTDQLSYENVIHFPIATCRKPTNVCKNLNSDLWFDCQVRSGVFVLSTALT